MNISVIYRSRMGASYYYAQALKENLEGNLFFHRSLPTDKSDILIYCAGLNRGRVDGWRRMGAVLKSMSRRVIVAASCITQPTEEMKQEIAKRNGIEADNLFLLRGKLDYSKANPLEKMVLRSMRSKLEGKKTRTREEGELLNALTYPTDYTDIRCILPIVKAVRG